MNLEYIEEIIDREKIDLIDTYLENTAGAYINYEKINIIMFDSSKTENSLKKKEVLSEELGHYFTDSTYKFTSSLDLVSKQEYRAKKWSYYTLIPYEKLESAILKRHL